MTDDLFERAPVPRAYFKLALPVVFSMVISLVYNMVDTFFIARTQNTLSLIHISRRRRFLMADAVTVRPKAEMLRCKGYVP